MPENISGVNNSEYSSLQRVLNNLKTTETTDKKTDAKTSSSNKSDESEYIDTNFENMDLDEVSKAASDLQLELLMIETQIKALEQIIESDENIQKQYEKQYQNLQAEYEKLLAESKNADEPEKINMLHSRMSGIKNSMDTIFMQINSVSDSIQSNNNMALSLQEQYSDTNTEYKNAIHAQNSIQSAIAAQSALQSATPAQNSTVAQDTSFDTVQNTPDVTSTSQLLSGSTKAATGRVSNNMLNALKNWEGLRTSAYKCPAGVWTIGYGHTKNVQPGQQISEAQAEQLLREDLQSFENEVTNMAKSAGVNLTQGQYDALVSFAYNCGGGALQKSGILGLLKAGNVSGAANKMNQYVHGGGQVLPGLVSRRKTESSWLYA